MNDHPNCRSSLIWPYQKSVPVPDHLFVDDWEPDPAELGFFEQPLPPMPTWSEPAQFISKRALAARIERIDVEMKLDRAERLPRETPLSRQLRDGPDGRGVAERPADYSGFPPPILAVGSAAVKAAAKFREAQLRLVSDQGEKYRPFVTEQLKRDILAMAERLNGDARAMAGPAPPPNPNQSDCTHGGVETGSTCPLCGRTA